MESTKTASPASMESSNAAAPALEPAPDKSPLLTSYTSSLLLLLTSYQTHFRSVGYVKESTLEVLDRTVAKRTLHLTVSDSRATKAIGSEAKIWTGLADVFRSAFISLENRCYPPLESLGPLVEEGDAGAPYLFEGPSSNVIVTHSASLLPDLQRLDTLLAIARNILSAGERVQNLAAQTGLDREICSVINLAVKVTARGYDGDGGQSDEDKFSGVVSAFKKLLITSLQFLNNLVTLNERLKLMLWVELFDASAEHGAQPAPNNDADPAQSDLAGAVDDMASLTNTQSSRSLDLQILRKPTKPLTPYLSYMAQNGDVVEKEIASEVETPSREDVAIEVTKRWHNLSEDKRRHYNEQYDEAFKTYQADLEAWERSLRPNSNQISRALSSSRLTRKTTNETLKDVRSKSEGDSDAVPPINMDVNSSSSHAQIKEYFADPDRSNFGQDNLKVPKEAIQSMSSIHSPDHIYSQISQSAADGIKMLEDGKSQLLKRLDHSDSATSMKYESRKSQPVYQPAPPSGEHDSAGNKSRVAVDDVAVRNEKVNNAVISEEEDYDEAEQDFAENDEHNHEDAGDDEEDDEESSEEGEDDEYSIAGEDGRGLLTDVPLILGPNEIEVLPMLIMSGITTEWADGKPPNATLMNMHTIRCHLLLAQENGRNLLRELLIYVAAWDLREDELYFKFMVKIMEAILLNGLLPYAYGAFKESKDIISPAQAVIMKLLTKVFHTRQAYVSPSGYDLLVRTAACSDNHLWGSWNSSGSAQTNDLPTMPDASPKEADPVPRADVQTVYFLVTEFRTVIIPQICVLIFLQGQIRAGRAQIEDFPQTLWEMERIYEGVYQYLEFFAILTDHDVWKERLANWELISELVTLLKELEFAIPKKVQIAPLQQLPGASSSTDVATSMDDQQTALAHQTKVMQEALQRLNSHFSDQPAPPAAPPASPSPTTVERPYDVDSPLSTSETPPARAKADGRAIDTPQQRHSPAEANPPPPPLPPPPPPRTTTPGALPAPLQDEPAEFEWRNLKKLCVLVLSSLVWKNKRLQDQVRNFGGINVLLSCCNGIDEHNPYIREHAIMCLRFLIEGNAECANVVKDLAQKGRRSQGRAEAGANASNDAAKPNKADVDADEQSPVLPVPPEVLDHHGYETFMDGKGQVGLRRKAATPSSHLSPAAHGRDADEASEEHGRGAKAGSATAAPQSLSQPRENAAQAAGSQGADMHVPPPTNPAQLPEWMQMVMRSLPRTHLTGGTDGRSPGAPPTGAQGGTTR